MTVHSLGPHPILRHFLARMDFPRLVNASLGRSREGLLDQAQALGVLVQNILLSPAPMYRIAQWAEPIDPAALGLTKEEKRALNDDRMGRVLDDLATGPTSSDSGISWVETISFTWPTASCAPVKTWPI